MENGIKTDYYVDLVFCIDATQSMTYILDTIKTNALTFYRDFVNTINRRRKQVTQLRVRVIAFRDYLYDREKATRVSRFFNLPQESEEYSRFLQDIHAEGGGDEQEDGLEALAFAMKSDWNNMGRKQRHMIVVWSDEGTHPLGFSKNSTAYPMGMAKSFDELTQWWGWGDKENPGLMNEDAKRLILFTPNKSSWTIVSENWNKVIHYETESGAGLRSVDYSTIMNAITKTI